MIATMSTRLIDVAKQAGVSQATVSRVLNGKAGVSEATRQAVLVALDVLGYERPTQLRGERGRLVGLMLPELQNPIFPAFADVVGSALAQGGYTPVLCTLTAGAISEAEYIDLLLQHQVSGVIFAGGLYTQANASHDHYARLRELRMPTVFVSAPYGGPRLPVRLVRRRGCGRAGLRPPRLARPHAHRASARTGRPHAVAPKAGGRACRRGRRGDRVR